MSEVPAVITGSTAGSHGLIGNRGSVGSRGGGGRRGCSDIQTTANYSNQYSVCYPYLTNWLNVYRGEFVLSLVVVLLVVSESRSFRWQCGLYC